VIHVQQNTALSPVEKLGSVAIAIDRILDDGEWHTSTELVCQLDGLKGSSRAQIQRVISKLRVAGKDLGFEIESNRRRGYRKSK
jgi:biotin operon repressor